QYTLLVVVDRRPPRLHQVEVRTADQDRLDAAPVQSDQLARPYYLTLVAGVEKQQVLRQRDDLERVLARAGGKQQVAFIVEDVAVERERRVEIEGAGRFR